MGRMSITRLKWIFGVLSLSCTQHWWKRKRRSLPKCVVLETSVLPHTYNMCVQKCNMASYSCMLQSHCSMLTVSIFSISQTRTVTWSRSHCQIHFRMMLLSHQQLLFPSLHVLLHPACRSVRGQFSASVLSPCMMSGLNQWFCCVHLLSRLCHSLWWLAGFTQKCDSLRGVGQTTWRRGNWSQPPLQGFIAG